MSILTFIIGIAAGITMILLYSQHQVMKIDKARKEKIKAVMKAAEDVEKSLSGLYCIGICPEITESTFLVNLEDKNVMEIHLSRQTVDLTKVALLSTRNKNPIIVDIEDRYKEWLMKLQEREEPNEYENSEENTKGQDDRLACDNRR